MARATSWFDTVDNYVLLSIITEVPFATASCVSKRFMRVCLADPTRRLYVKECAPQLVLFGPTSNREPFSTDPFRNVRAEYTGHYTSRVRGMAGMVLPASANFAAVSCMTRALQVVMHESDLSCGAFLPRFAKLRNVARVRDLHVQLNVSCNHRTGYGVSLILIDMFGDWMLTSTTHFPHVQRLYLHAVIDDSYGPYETEVYFDHLLANVTKRFCALRTLEFHVDVPGAAMDIIELDELLSALPTLQTMILTLRAVTYGGRRRGTCPALLCANLPAASSLRRLYVTVLSEWDAIYVSALLNEYGTCALDVALCYSHASAVKKFELNATTWRRTDQRPADWKRIHHELRGTSHRSDPEATTLQYFIRK